MTLALACLLVTASIVTGVVSSAPARAAAAGCGAESACLRVHLNGCGASGSTVIVGLDKVDNQWRDAPSALTYRLRYESGGVIDERVNGGLTVRGLLTRVGCNPGTVQTVTVRGTQPAFAAALTSPAFGPASANGYESGLLPLFTTGGTGRADSSIGFIRPLASPDPGGRDINGREFRIPLQGPLDVFVDGTDQVGVEISGPGEAELGEAAAFTSVVDPAGDYDYRWTFGDGGTSSDGQPRHTFTSSGSFDVSVQVSGDGYGQSNVVRVQVQGEDEPPPDGPRGGGPRGGGPAGGPKATDAPTGGTAEDPDAPETGPDADSDGTTGGAAPGPRVTDPGRGGAGQTATEPDEGTSEPGKGQAERRTPAPGEVQGVLLAGGAGVLTSGAARSPSASAGQEPTAPAARAALGGSGGGLWWGAGLLPVLLLLGAVGETGLLAALRAKLRRNA